MRDLTAYQVHVSLDGSSWELIASAQHHPTPHERDVHIRRSLVSASYLWPYYLIVLSKGLAGLSVASASLLSCVVSLKTAARWKDAPVQLLGVCHLVKGLGIWIALGSLLADNQRLPFGPIEYTFSSLGLESTLDMVLWPGPLALTQANAYESALLWGVIMTTYFFATGSYSNSGPVYVIVAGTLIYFRWKRRAEAERSVQGDKRLFDQAWACIQAEHDGEAGIAALRAFKQEKLVAMQISPGGVGVEQTVRASALKAGAARRGGGDSEMTHLDLEVGSSSTNCSPGTAEGGAGTALVSAARGKLFLEQVSPVLSAAISQRFQESRPVTSLDQLYSQAVVMESIFRVQVQQLAKSSRGRFYVSSSGAGDQPELKLWSEIEKDESELSRVRWPAIKQADHAMQKVSVCYHGNVARLRVVRQRIIFYSLSDICHCLYTIAASPDLKIVGFQNSFDADSDAQRTAGYRHVMVMLCVVTDATAAFGLTGHCCELQLSHQRMARLITPEEHARYLTYNRIVVPFDRTGWKEALLNFQGFMSSKVGDDDVPAAHNASGLARTVSSRECMCLEDVYSQLGPVGALDLSVETQAEVSKRVFDVLRWTCRFEGDMLDSTLKHKTKLAVDTADATTILFVSPLGAILKWPFALFTCMAGLFFGFFYWTWILDLRNSRHQTRHVRFRALETRAGAPLHTDAGVGVTISLFETNMCKIASESLDSKSSSASVFIALPKSTTIDGWSMTSPLEAGSEPSDPVRFDFSVAALAGTYSLSDCLLGNSWSTAEEMRAMSAGDQRDRVIAELSKVPGGLCAEVDSDGISRCEQLGQDDLVRNCVPAHKVREDDWVVVSASKCRYEPNGVNCLPRPSSYFEYLSLERGFTHTFDLRPPWFVKLGVVHTSLPVVVGCPLTALLGFRGYLWPARIGLAFIMFTPGLLELITAVALATAKRTASSDIQPWDSFYWWVLSFTSMVIGSCPVWPEKYVQRTSVHLMALWFIFTFPALNIHYTYILQDPRIRVPNSGAFMFCVWLVYQVSRLLVLAKSKRDVDVDLRRYNDEWNSLLDNLEEAAAIRDLEDITSRFSSKTRPVQRISPLHANHDANDMLPFVPLNLLNAPSPLIVSRMFMTRQGALGDSPSHPTCSPCDSLDTLYFQAYLLEPIFNHKVKQIAVAAKGEFLDTANEGSGAFVAAEGWESTGMAIKSVDRSVEKLSRCYQGKVSLLVDVCRSCVVFDSMQDLMKAMRVIADDPQLQIVRVKNRLSHSYDANESAGYRDVLVNLCISNALTQKFGLALHICELQLSHKRFMTHRTADGHKRYVAYRNKRSE